jgi:hypothetical protein
MLTQIEMEESGTDIGDIHYLIFKLGATGRVDILEWLLQQEALNDRFSDSDWYDTAPSEIILASAIVGNQMSVLEWYKEKKLSNRTEFGTAGHYDYHTRQTNVLSTKDTPIQFKCLPLTPETCEWLFTNDLCKFTAEDLDFLIRYADIKVLEWCMRTNKFNTKFSFCNPFVGLIANDRLSAINWILTHLAPLASSGDIYEDYFNAALRCGRLDILKYCMDALNVFVPSATLLEIPVRNDCVEITSWLLQKKCSISAAVAHTAMARGTMGIVRVLLKSNYRISVGDISTLICKANGDLLHFLRLTQGFTPGTINRAIAQVFNRSEDKDRATQIIAKGSKRITENEWNTIQHVMSMFNLVDTS